ncbi:MAG: IS481 family transposase [Thermoleophilaceae bacterium]
MILHANAVLSRRQRERLVALVFAGATITAAALVVGCSRQTASKWVNRARRGEGLHDRSSRPRCSPRRTSAAVEQAVLRARRELRLGPHPLGWALGLPSSTVHAILRRHGCSRLKPRLPREAVIRYERERPGELLHVDLKKLGRIIRPGHRVTGDRSKRAKGKAGWLYLFAAIDDATRLGFARLYADETAASAIAFLDACRGFYGQHGIAIERVLTDNGTCFKRRWADRCEQLEIAVRKTRPYRPQTNGKAERFIRTLLELWAYAYPYQHEHQRAAALAPALDSYNRFRRHRALGGLTPLQRVNNLSGTNT